MAAQDFFNEVYAEARSLGCNHIQAALCAAQAGWETGWGRHVKGNAYFGVKAGRSWRGDTQTFGTHEVLKGKRVAMKDRFRAYNNRLESIRDYVQLMPAKWPKAWTARTMSEAARGLDEGRYGRYATDPDYSAKIYKVMRSRAARAAAAYSGGGHSGALVLRRGDSGPKVGELLARLAELGYYTGPQDAIFGGGAELALRDFQIDAGLGVDGIYGPETRAALAGWKRRAAPRKSRPSGSTRLVYVNQNAIRNQPITRNLERKIPGIVELVLGPGCRIEVYSGGQPVKGGKRTGSVRHNNYGEGGRAADIRIYRPDGNLIGWEEAGRVGQAWLASRYGGVGAIMSGGGIHVDEWVTPPRGGGMFWTYKASDARPWGRLVRKMLEQGHSGQMPELYAAPDKPPKPMPPVRPTVTEPSRRKLGLGSALAALAAIAAGGLSYSAGWLSDALTWLGW